MAKVEVRGIIDGLNDVSFNGYDITEVMVPQALMSMGMASVFPNSYGNITSIRCAPDVTSIGAGNLTGCGSLTKFQFSNSISSVDSTAFSGINGIDYVVYGTNINLPMYARFANVAPSGTKVEWTEGCTNTGDRCCYGSMYLTTVIVPQSLVVVDDYTFGECLSLERIDLPSGLSTIGSGAFYRCEALESISLPDTLTSIGDEYTFAFCSSLTEIEIPDSVVALGVDLFFQSGLTTVRIGKGTSTIDYSAFNGCRSLSAFIVSEENQYFKSVGGLLLSKDGTAVIKGAGGDTGNVVVPVGVESLHDNSFQWIDTIVTLTLPNSIEELPYGAFLGCKSLVGIDLGTGISVIPEECFEECESLQQMTIPPSVTTINSMAFSYSGITSISIPETVTELGDASILYYGAFYACSDLVSITVDAANPNYMSSNNMLLTKDGKTLLQGVNGNVVIPNYVETIYEYAFAGLHNLTSVTIPSSVTEIGVVAFDECSGLTSIVFLGNCPQIESGAFSGVNESCIVYVPQGSTGWGVTPGTGEKWNGLEIVYST